MKEKKDTLQGKYVCSKSENELKSAQTLRALLYAALLILFIVPPLLLKSEAMRIFNEKKYLPLTTAYVIIMIFTAALCVFSFICSFSRYKIRKTVYRNCAPKLGFERHTYSVIEWQFYLTAICALIHLCLMFYAFSWHSFGLTVTSLAAAACAYFIKDVSFKVYDKSIEFIPLEEEMKNSDESEESDPNTSTEQNKAQKPETNLKTYAENEEIEDFYDRD